MLLYLFIIFTLISSRFIAQQNQKSEHKFQTLLNKKITFIKEEEEEDKTPNHISASTTNKFHILSAFTSEVHINGGDEVEIQIDKPKSKEVFCKIGLKVFKGLNKDDKTMICLLPQYSRQIIDGQDKIFISLSFDKIHWCEPYPLKIIQEGNYFSILALLAIFSLNVS